MFQSTLAAVNAQFSGGAAKALLERIWIGDRWSSFDKYRQTAQVLAESLKGRGLSDVEIIPLPADGRTCYGDWTMPKAWDCASGRLAVAAPDEAGGPFVLADYYDCPCALVMWCPATPAGGASGPVVVMDELGDPSRAPDLSGKFLLTRVRPRDAKGFTVASKALGVLSDYQAEYPPSRLALDLPDVVGWTNSWMDYDRGGWGFKEGDSDCLGFCLTPRQGRRLRDLVARYRELTVRAEVDARIYEGLSDVVTGVLPGESEEEVLILGHFQEQGAIDNASGVAVSIEILGCLRELVDRGVLPRPRRSIRALFAYECHGTMGAFVTRPELFERTVAGLNLDCVGGREEITRAPLDCVHNPHAATSFADSLLPRLMAEQARRHARRFSWREIPCTFSDNIIADPTIGVPTPLLMECPYRSYHSSADVPDAVDPKKLHWVAGVAGAYLHLIADADGKAAAQLARLVAVDARKAISAALERALAGKGPLPAREDLDAVATRYQVALQGCAALAGAEDVSWLEPLGSGLRAVTAVEADNLVQAGCPGQDEPTGDVEGLVPRRLVPGLLRKTRIPREQHAAFGQLLKDNRAAGKPLESALLWTDGTRDLAEITRLARHESGSPAARFDEVFRALERYEYVAMT